MSEILDLTDQNIVDYFEIKSLGLMVFILPAPFEMSRDKPEITGRIVRLRFEDCVFERVVAAVDRFLPATPIRKGEMIGLAVEPVDFHG